MTDLRPEDFEIREDGKVQKITAFSYVQPKGSTNPSSPKRRSSALDLLPPSAPKPEDIARYIVLVADDIGLSWQSTAYVRIALKRFVDRQMRSGDLVAIMRTSRGGSVIQGFTTDKAQLYAAVDAVRYSLNGGGLFPAVSVLASAGTKKDTITGPAKSALEEDEGDEAHAEQEYLVSGAANSLVYMIRGLRNLPGRKAVVYFSDGIPISLKAGAYEQTVKLLNQVTDECNRASVVMNTIDARGLLALAPDASGDAPGDSVRARRDLNESQAPLELLATKTGGRSLESGNDLSWGITRVLEDLDSYYLIGYKPDGETFDKLRTGDFHKLSIRVLRRGLHVRTRAGFFGVNDDVYQAAATPRDQLRNALESPFHANDIATRLTCLFERFEKSPLIDVYLHIDVSKLDFQLQPDGSRIALVDLLIRAVDSNGDITDAANVSGDIGVKPENWERTQANGMVISTKLAVPKPGGIQVRAAVRDRANGLIGSTGDFLIVPDLKKGRLAIGGVALGSTEASAGAGNAAVRSFAPGAAVPFKMSIFNAKPAHGGGPADLTARVRIFHDGELISTTPDVTVKGVLNAARQVANGTVRIRPDWQPGDYYVQVIVTGHKSGSKVEQAAAWSDFAIATQAAGLP